MGSTRSETIGFRAGFEPGELSDAGAQMMVAAALSNPFRENNRRAADADDWFTLDLGAATTAAAFIGRIDGQWHLLGSLACPAGIDPGCAPQPPRCPRPRGRSTDRSGHRDRR